MTIDPNSLPEGAVVEINRAAFVIREGGYVSGSFEGGLPFLPTRTVARAFVPVPDGMAYADAVAALADAGAWVGVIDPVHCPVGARMMNRWTNGLGGDNLYVHRDDLPPTDPDAEAVEVMARAAALDAASALPWEDRSEAGRDEWRDVARAALAALREHEAKS